MSSAISSNMGSDGTPKVGSHFEVVRNAPDSNAEHERTARDPSNTNGKNEPRMLPVRAYDIHDILRGSGTPLTVGDLQWIIGCQANLHGCNARKDENTLKKYLSEHGSTIRGFVLHAEGKMPVAYAIYYQTVDEKGDKVAYCEDFYINDSFRNQGVAKVLFQELAARTLSDNCKYLQWATDGRNQQVLDFVTKKLGAKTPEEIGKITISANELLLQEHRHKLFSDITGRPVGPRRSPYETKPLSPNDLPDLYKVGLSPAIIDGSGALPFKGYITRNKNNPNEVLAVTPGWIHFSTFQLKEGLHLESPSFAPNLSEQVKTDVMLSVLEKATSFRKSYESGPHNNHIRWHISQKDEFMVDLLQNKLDLKVDTMTDDPKSRLHVFQLENGRLDNMAKSEPARFVTDKVQFPYHADHKPDLNGKPGNHI